METLRLSPCDDDIAAERPNRQRGPAIAEHRMHRAAGAGAPPIIAGRRTERHREIRADGSAEAVGVQLEARGVGEGQPDRSRMRRETVAPGPADPAHVLDVAADRL